MSKKLSISIAISIMVGIGTIVLFIFAAPVTEDSDVKEPRLPVWHLSLIKSKDGHREHLEQFIAANWLKPDEIAYKKGYILGYRMFHSADNKSQWDVAVITMYSDLDSYNNINKKYEPIMKGHQQQLINGLDFKDLGDVVESRVMTSIQGAP